MLLGSPIWLIALAAVCIPVVIHLWNIKPGKTLKVGSISLLSESSPKSSRSFKLIDLLLLLLRCLLLSLLAFLLATPLWQQHLKAGKVKGWLLIPKNNFNETYHHFKFVIDSASKKGYEFHYLDKGFPKAELAELIQHPGKDTASARPANYWLLSKQLGSRVPPSVNAEIFTPNTLTHFTGSQPETNLNIHWHTYTPADSISTWLSGAWLTGNGNIRLVQGTATPTGTSYQYHDIKNGGSASAYNVGMENGAPVVSLNNAPAEKIKVDTAALNIAIYTDKNSLDVNYLKAALDAVNQLMQRKIFVKIYTQPNAIPANQDWLFWLSEKPVDPNFLQKTKQLFTYASGKVNVSNSWISYTGDHSVTQGQTKIVLYKSIAAKSVTATTIWSDGFGDQILSMEPGKTNTYHFYSRFNPAWNDLVWSDEFPKWLLQLMAHLKPYGSVHERRVISTQQLQPIHINTTNETIVPQTQQVSLVNYLWLLLTLVFLAERWLATKNERMMANG